MDILLDISDAAKKLWQGKGVDIDNVTKVINEGVQMIVEKTPAMQQSGINFPMEYVSTAMRNMAEAIKKRDDYLLADNLYYEWKEIFIVFNEIALEIEE